MRRIALTLLVVTTVAVTAIMAQEKTGEKPMDEGAVTYTGILVDMKCFSMSPENVKNDHMTPKGKMPQCATACAKMGIPAGVFVEGGEEELIVLITPPAQIADHMAKDVKVTGTPVLDGKGIVPDKIYVRSGDDWEEVKIATMM